VRVTDRSVERNYLYSVNHAESRLAKFQDMATTGMNYSKPQDDPIGVERSIALRHHIALNQQYLRNADRAMSWMSQVEQSLGDINDIITRAQDLAIQGETATTPDDAQAYIAMEIRQLRDEIDSIARRTMEGKSLLIGTLPVWKVGPGLTVTVNDLTGLLDQLSSDLTTLENGLNTQDVTQIRAARDNLAVSADAVLSERAENGARMNRLEMLNGKMTSLDIEYKRLLSNSEDVDLTELLIKLQSAEAAYQAALGVGARLIQPTLLDHLR
jgi:flagellar hook-associated protein 3 FlgL